MISPVRPKKALGQNFLTDPGIISRIVGLAGVEERDLVVEVGPGKGILTRSLLFRAGRVVAIELDRELLPILEVEFGGDPRFTLVAGDALQIDLARLLDDLPGSSGLTRKVVANIPYYITGPLLVKLLTGEAGFETIVLMVQKEVADRLVATPGSPEYGSLSVIVNYFTQPQLGFRVRRGAFQPPPKVDSAVVRLDRRKDHWPLPWPRVEPVVRAAFGQRRKTLVNAVSAGMNLPKDAVAVALQHLGLPATIRGEELSVAQFVQLASGLADAARGEERHG